MAINRLSDFLGVTDAALAQHGVLNAIISVDNRFFIEPRLLLHTRIPFFIDASAKIEAYFQRVITLLSASKVHGDIAWVAACQSLQFREPQGFALGYGVHQPNGRGVGKILAEGLASRAQQILKLGIDDPLVFEVIELFTDGMGPDLISDTQASILEENFLAYSQDVANKLQIARRAIRVVANRSYYIPAGPNGRGLVLLPEEFLTPLPVEMPWESIEYAAALDASVRKQLSELFALAARKPTKSEIANVLFPNLQVMQRLLTSFRESVGSKYDFDGDPMGVLRWFEVALHTVQAYPADIKLEFQTPSGLVDVIQKIMTKFKQNVEQNGLWKEFYRDDLRPKHERFGQLLFFAVADAYCDANNLDISRESNGGNGPVDFKLSKGAEFKYLVEMKLSSNPKLLDGYTVQLDAYAASEKAEKKALIVVKVNGKGAQLERLVDFHRQKRSAGQACPELIIVDATDQLSASKRNRDRPESAKAA